MYHHICHKCCKNLKMHTRGGSRINDGKKEHESLVSNINMVSKSWKYIGMI